MFEVGWAEMLVIMIVIVVVVGPEDLPRMLRTMGRMRAKARSVMSDFQNQFQESLKEVELDNAHKLVDELRSLNPAHQIRKQLNPFEQAVADMQVGIDSAIKLTEPITPPSADEAVHQTKLLKERRDDDIRRCLADDNACGTGVPGVRDAFDAGSADSSICRSKNLAAAKPKALAKTKRVAKPKADEKSAARSKIVTITSNLITAKASAAKTTANKALTKAVEPNTTKKED